MVHQCLLSTHAVIFIRFYCESMINSISLSPRQNRSAKFASEIYFTEFTVFMFHPVYTGINFSPPIRWLCIYHSNDSIFSEKFLHLSNPGNNKNFKINLTCRIYGFTYITACYVLDCGLNG